MHKRLDLQDIFDKLGKMPEKKTEERLLRVACKILDRYNKQNNKKLKGE